MKVLVTGADGQVGRALSATCPAGVELCAAPRAALDIVDQAQVQAAVSSAAPAVIINGAAYTAVDRAEADAEQAMAVNALGPRHLAEAAKSLPGCRLLHISTDYVFDGSSARPYRPQDPPNPINVYGRTKLQGEQAVLSIMEGRAVVLRTAWVYATAGRNFLLTMLKHMRERGEVRVVSDQRGTPTAALSVAKALWRACELTQVSGVLHWTDDGEASWYEFACAIAEIGTKLALFQAKPRVVPISTAAYPTAARRPMCSVLDLEDSIAMLALKPTRWRSNLQKILSNVR